MSSKLKTVVRRTWYRPGIVVLEEHYAGNRLHGPRREWHRNGQLAEEEIYRHGLLHGLCRQWNADGKLLGSFQMVNGTGVQKSWHDNGRLNMEFSTVAGEFCGRGRTWLRDGTLIAENVTLFNRAVTPARYRRAAATDPRLPKLPGRIGKPPIHNCALERHTYRVFVAWLLKKRSRVVLPSAARRRSFRFGFVPAVSPPALHFSARRTADRSVRWLTHLPPTFTGISGKARAGDNRRSQRVKTFMEWKIPKGH